MKPLESENLTELNNMRQRLLNDQAELHRMMNEERELRAGDDDVVGNLELAMRSITPIIESIEYITSGDVFLFDE